MTSKQLVTALTMMGAVALVGCNKESGEESASTVADETSQIEDHASKTLDDAKGEGEKVVKGAEQAMDDVKQQAEDVVDDVKEKVKEQVSEKAAEVSAQAKEAMDVYLTKLSGATDVLKGVKSQFGAVSALPKLTGLAGDIKKQWGTLSGLSPDSMGQLTNLFGGRISDVVGGFKGQLERMKGSGDFGAITQLLEKIPLPSSEPSK